VRIVAAGLAARLGFTLDDIEDLKIAVDELAAYITGGRGREGTLEIRFGVGDDHIAIEGTARLSEEEKPRTQLTDMSQMILATVVDSATLQHRDGTPTFSVVKRMRP
jgi:serine/threonine-protein kinase RsbW